MKKNIILFQMLIFALSVWGQDPKSLDNNSTPKIYYNKYNVDTLIKRYPNVKTLDSIWYTNYCFINNGNYYLVDLSLDENRHIKIGDNERIIERDFRLYVWKNHKWVYASDDVVTTIFTKSWYDENTQFYNTTFDFLLPIRITSFPKTTNFNDTIVMLTEHNNSLHVNKKVRIIYYNTIAIMIPKGNGEYDIYSFKPANIENDKYYDGTWILQNNIVKKGSTFIFPFYETTIKINIDYYIKNNSKINVIQ